jgi:hypothetical protein
MSLLLLLHFVGIDIIFLKGESGRVAAAEAQKMKEAILYQ